MRTKPVSHQYGVPTKELAGAARAAEPKSAVEEKKELLQMRNDKKENSIHINGSSQAC